MSATFVFDIDGTCAIRGDRSPYDWDRVGEDKPNYPVLTCASALAAHGYEIVYLSGRDSVCRPQTVEWLAEHCFPTGQLIMRAAKDNRPDAVVKRELYDDWLSMRDILAVFDDRDQVVEMWRSIGLPCFQVAPGDF